MQKSKSTTAAEATCDINPDLQVEAHLNKVCPATEGIYNDSFFSRINVVVTALDNVEARRYVDRSVHICRHTHLVSLAFMFECLTLVCISYFLAAVFLIRGLFWILAPWEQKDTRKSLCQI